MASDTPLQHQDNVIRYLSHWASRFPEKPAIVFPEAIRADGSLDYVQLSFSELESRVNRLAAALKAQGMQRGDRMVVMIPMSLELYIVLLALLKLAVIIVFIDPWVGLEQIKRCVDLTQPQAFAGTPVIQMLARLTNVLKGIPMRLTARGPARFGELALESLLGSDNPAVETAIVDPDTTALITFTTGSTGTPKGANRTHGFLVAQHLALARELQLQPSDVDLPALPIFILNNLASGVTSIVPHMKPSKPSEIEPAVIVRQIMDFQVTTAVGAPSYFNPIATYCLEQKIQLSSIRAVFTGGGPVPPGLLSKLRRILPNGTATVGYGSTEAEPVALISAQEVCESTGRATEAGRGNCVGRLAQGISAKVIQVVEGPVELGAEGWHDVECERGGIGELVVTGAHVGKDYYRNPEAVKENKILAPDGEVWHRMGDVAYFDDHDRLWIVGRVNNVLQRETRSIYPLQAEAIAHQLPFIEKAALLGIPDEEVGHRVALIVVPHEKHWLSWLRKRKEWHLRVRSHLEAHGIPVDAVIFAKRLPLDPRHNSKVDYARLERQHGRKLRWSPKP